MSIDGDRNLANFIPDRLPEFVRVDHPTLVAFLSAYYEWLGLRRNEGKILSPLQLKDVGDIDSTLDQFVDQFKAQFLLNFPEKLAINPDTQTFVDPRRLVKNIRQFYLAKGTEKSYEFLFRILYDVSVEFYYPKTDILRLSSGRWTRNNYLRISNVLGDRIYRAAGNIVVQRNASGGIAATARCVEVTVYQIGHFEVAELLISGRNGTFSAGSLGVEFIDGGETFRENRIYSVITGVTVNDRGTDYQIGDRVVFVPAQGDSGQKGIGTVSEVDVLGGIRKIAIDDFGINYESPPSISVSSIRGSGFSGTVSVGGVAQSDGFYSNNDGRLSTNKVIQDNHYYQNWSYVLKSEVVIDRYREIVRRLIHPVGTAMFGSVLVKRCAKDDLANASSLVRYEVPIIGHYVPYTFRTFDDLSVWFMTGITGGMTAAGYNPAFHDPLIRSEGEEGGLVIGGNPITNGIPFEATGGALGLTGFQNADPFWIVYEHPNRKVVGQSHIAKVWTTQLSDFIEWKEWTLSRDPSNSARIEEWIRELRAKSVTESVPASCCLGSNYRENYDFSYALLDYDENTEFRKITARAFFEMPIGERFDCRAENVVSPATPRIVVVSPQPGATVQGIVPRGTYPGDFDFFRNITVTLSVQNEENLSLPKFQGGRIRATMDNARSIEFSLNTRRFSFPSMSDGRHTLRIEFVDAKGRLIPGTREIVIFGYELVIPTETISDEILGATPEVPSAE